jgi:hypothetical protein
VNKIVLLNYGLNRELGITRNMWQVSAGDIVVSAIPVDERFLTYLCEVCGMDRDTITVLNIGQGVEEMLTSPVLAGRLRVLTGGSDDWELYPAAYTYGAAALAELLGLRSHAGLRFAGQRGDDLLNRKSHFRQLAAGAGVSIADGSVVTTEADLTAAVERMLPATGTVVVKRDNDLGGHGNWALTTKEARPLNGVWRTIAVNGNLAEITARLWNELTDEGNMLLVVETYHHAKRVFYFEYVIDAEGRPRILNTGLKRETVGEPGAPRQVWLGLEIPADLPPGTTARALTESGQIAEIVARLGYRGHVNVDGVYTEDGSFFFTEVNARWGGCTSLHNIGEKVLGPDYADDHVISGLRVVTPMRLWDAVDLLRRHDLHFTPESGEGVLVLGYDGQLAKATECVLIGRTRARVREIEERLRAVAGTVTDPALVESALVELNEEVTG